MKDKNSIINMNPVHRKEMMSEENEVKTVKNQSEEVFLKSFN